MPRYDESMSSTGELPPELATWVESSVGGRITSAQRATGGASRTSWSIDVKLDDGSTRALFLLRDAEGRATGGSARDAAVLRALADQPVPVPPVLGDCPDLGALLLDRIEGRSDFPGVDQPQEREPTAAHLMEIAAALHGIDPALLDLEHALPEVSSARGALDQIEESRRLHAGLPEPEPLIAFGLRWLERHAPQQAERVALVHGDLGPGNFIYSGGRVRAVVDWEIAHLGDPAEDLAALSVRDMATPIGHLPTRFSEYARASGVSVDLERVRYYRVLVLVRNVTLLCAALAHAPPSSDVAQIMRFRALLMRAAARALCDAAGTRSRSFAMPAPLAETPRTGIRNAARAALHEFVLPALSDPYAHARAAGVDGLLAYLDLCERLGPRLDAAELEQASALLGQRLTSLEEATARLVRAAGASTDADDGAWIAYLQSRAQRICALARPLMGELAERELQPLEDE
jgi:aminoglycoside phosphotransferase (APT) family kinase protein